MKDFEYEQPQSLAEAVQLVQEHKGAARLLAGGTDLIDQVRMGRYQPDYVIDIKKIPELNILEHSSEGLRIGAAVPCYKIYGDKEIVKQYSALTDSCTIIGGTQIQSRASVGGNLCNSGPAGDSIPSLIALDATCVIAGNQGERTVPVADFCTGPGKNVLKPGELLVELRFPARPAHSSSHFRRFIPRNEMDIAVVSVGASVVLDDKGETIVSARIALGAVGPKVINAVEAADALAGQPVNEDSIQKAAEIAISLATPITDMRGTKEYRLHLTGVLTKRVLLKAIERAKA